MHKIQNKGFLETTNEPGNLSFLIEPYAFLCQKMVIQRLHKCEVHKSMSSRGFCRISARIQACNPYRVCELSTYTLLFK